MTLNADPSKDCPQSRHADLTAQIWHYYGEESASISSV